MIGMGFRRVGTAVGMCLCASVLLAGTSGADTPEVYVGSAAGKALELTMSLNGAANSLTFGVSDAKVDSTLAATAHAAGQLLSGTLQTAQVAGNNTSQANPQACGPIGVPAQDVGLSLTTACASSSAAVANGFPVATGQGSVAALAVNVATLTKTLQLTQPLKQVPAVGTPVADVLTSVLNTQSVSASLGDSSSNVTTSGATVTSTAKAAGGVIKLLPSPIGTTPNGLVSTDPVATITVSSSQAQSVYDRATGKSTAAFNPALVSVHFNPTLGIPDVTVAPGASKSLFEGTPLQTDITVANGSTVTNPDGSMGATASGVRVDLLRDPADTTNKTALLSLKFAHAEAGVGGTPAVLKPLPQPQLPRDLPRTGGTPWIPMAGAGALVLALVVRRSALWLRDR
jgi:hypothetical protein